MYADIHDIRVRRHERGKRLLRGDPGGNIIRLSERAADCDPLGEGFGGDDVDEQGLREFAGFERGDDFEAGGAEVEDEVVDVEPGDEGEDPDGGEGGDGDEPLGRRSAHGNTTLDHQEGEYTRRAGILV